MVRLYGKNPYKVVLIHGGPGAAGSLKIFAKKLSQFLDIGVVEALQTKYSVDELIEELYSQIIENCQEKVVLIGHSWGAWLTALFANKYSNLCKNIILVGCPPLKEEYVKQITIRRLQNMTQAERTIFQRLIDNTATDEDMAKIPSILENSDNFCLSDIKENEAEIVDSQMYNSIWGEAAKMRANGVLLSSFNNIKCKISLIHGTTDPHPITGVTEPLKSIGAEYEMYKLDKCGHSPFLEQYAKENFYMILSKIIN